MAPVIHLKGCIGHRHTLYALLQLFEEHATAFVEIFIIDANRQHKVIEFAIGHFLSPVHLLACTQCVVHIHLVEVNRIVGCIRYGHIGIQELHGEFGITCQSQFLYICKNLRHRIIGFPRLEIFLYSVVNRCCRSYGYKQHYGNKANSFFYHISFKGYILVVPQIYYKNTRYTRHIPIKKTRLAPCFSILISYYCWSSCKSSYFWKRKSL